MDILVVNTGSSSLKLSVLDPADQVVAATEVEHWDTDEPPADLTTFLNGLSGVGAVGHRIVHGGPTLQSAALIDDGVRQAIEAATDLAPLHQPRALAGIDVVSALLPDVPAVACFDTAFHARMPAAAATYALPAAWRERFGLRRYGFHGLSHGYATRRAAQLLGTSADALRLVSCHLGAGASLAAVRFGQSVDTTMGFTPLEGLVMATRAGNTDPGLLLWLLRDGGLGLEELATGLEHGSGLAGLAGSADMRDVIRAADAADPAATLALEVYLHRLRQLIAGMAAAMDGLDVLVFTGGIGEHQPTVRARAALGFLGVGIDPQRNLAAAADADISAAGSAVATLVVTAREDIEMAHQVRQVRAAARTAG
ncbi:MAG TPA: acetate/propionate family kinase [Streptosporangiaceae bacterium]|nr:acetate/propionate family kinase [Streptosporangiaceae bacterium]